jgi:dinuclear metal center YbgI/SA1388 family protein
MNPVRVGEVVDLVEARYPPALAEDWDVVGLTVGSRAAPVTKINFAVEATLAVVDEAVATGADLIIAHHPLLLRGVHTVVTDSPSGMIIEKLLRHSVALLVVHTNADVAPGGVVDALADALGVTDRRPLRPRPGEPLDKIITFVPRTHWDAVVDALAAAGAGRLGAYDRCAFLAEGTGTFRPLPGAHPFLGEPGRIEVVEESRVEMVLRRALRAEVLAALIASHPYETPAYDLLELAGTPSADTGLGRVGRLAEAVTLAEFSARVAEALPRTGAGVRIAGDRGRRVVTVAVQAGAGDDLLTEARRARADVYVTSDLRHHPAGEALAWPGAPALVDISHWAAEWTWLPVVERLVTAELTGRGTPVPTQISVLATDPWTDHLP